METKLVTFSTRSKNFLLWSFLLLQGILCLTTVWLVYEIKSSHKNVMRITSVDTEKNSVISPEEREKIFSILQTLSEEQKKLLTELQDSRSKLNSALNQEIKSPSLSAMPNFSRFSNKNPTELDKVNQALQIVMKVSTYILCQESIRYTGARLGSAYPESVHAKHMQLFCNTFSNMKKPFLTEMDSLWIKDFFQKNFSSKEKIK